MPSFEEPSHRPPTRGWAGEQRKSCASEVARGGFEPPTLHFSGARYYQLSYLARSRQATLMGLEPTTSAVTGRRANQLRYRAIVELSARAERAVEL